MFKITPVQDKSRQNEVCEMCGTVARDGFFAYVMYDCDTLEVMGMSQFEIGETGYISDLREPEGHSDTEAMFILGRQTMCFIESCGASICTAAHDAGDPKLLHAIGFRDGGDRLSCDMTGMFDGHCGNH